MLPKFERLKDNYLFNLTFKKKQKVSSDLMVLYYLVKRNNINNLPKTAFVVSLSVDKRSVKRNLVKRRMKAAYKMLKEKVLNLNSSKALILIWVGIPKIKDAPFIEIKRSMEYLLTKLGKVISQQQFS